MVVQGSIQGKLESQIVGLEIGESGFTMPWALSFETAPDFKYNVYLNLTYTIHRDRFGAAQLSVKRIGPKDTDFEIDLNSVSSNYRWNIGKGTYVGQKDGDVVMVGQIDQF